MNLVRLLTILVAFFAFAGVGPAQTASKLSTEAVGDLVDVNHATAAELKTLPGIGEAYSLAILKHRPYKNKTQLRSMGVIPLAAYQKIKDKIVAKQ